MQWFAAADDVAVFGRAPVAFSRAGPPGQSTRNGWQAKSSVPTVWRCQRKLGMLHAVQAPRSAPMAAASEPPMLSSQPIRVSKPALAIGQYPPSPDTVASKSVPGSDSSQGPAHPQSWRLLDSFRCSPHCVFRKCGADWGALLERSTCLRSVLSLCARSAYEGLANAPFMGVQTRGGHAMVLS